jgi:hypothetical protein
MGLCHVRVSEVTAPAASLRALPATAADVGRGPMWGAAAGGRSIRMNPHEPASRVNPREPA